MLTWILPFRKNKSALKANGLIFALATSALISTYGCSFRHEKNSPEDLELTLAQLNSKSIGYAEIRSAILEPKCLSCHSGRSEPNLTTYESVKLSLQDIERTSLRVFTMPKNRPLSSSLQRYLERWILMGAPEFAVRENPAPVPETILRPVTFSQIKSKLFETHCNSCHSINNDEGLTELETYASTLSVKDWLKPFIFGEANGEIIPEADRMPPPKSPQLSQGQKTLLLLWFEDGLKE